MAHFKGFDLIGNVWRTQFKQFLHYYCQLFLFTSFVLTVLIRFQCAHAKGRSCPVKEGIFLSAVGLVYSSTLSLFGSYVLERLWDQWKLILTNGKDVWFWSSLCHCVCICRLERQLVKMGSCFQNSLCRRNKGMISFKQNLRCECDQSWSPVFGVAENL